MPGRAVWATVLVGSTLTCINLAANSVGYEAVVSLATVTVTFSYTVCISTLLWRRFFGRPLPKQRFTLGSWGTIVNIVALSRTAPLTVLTMYVGPLYRARATLLVFSWHLLVLLCIRFHG